MYNTDITVKNLMNLSLFELKRNRQ